MSLPPLSESEATDDGTAALLDFAALAAEVVEVARPLNGGTGCNRRQRGGGRRRGRQRLGDLRRALECRSDRRRRDIP